MDTLKEGDLFEIVKNLNKKYAFSVFLIDEIHFHDNYEQKLKKIYDFLDVRVIFSSSVSLAMHEASYDLSRRIQLINLYPFSFREYIYFKKDILLPKLSIEDIHDKKWEPEHLRFEYLFEEYLMGGLFPFGLDEPQILPLLKNILKKIIFKDIPSFAQLMTDELDILDKVIKFIGTSKVEGINYSSLAKNIGITKYKAEKYLEILKKAFVIQVIFPSGTNVLKEPKVLMHLPFRLLYNNYENAIGGIREDFTAEMLSMKKTEFYYLKSTRGAKTPDFLIKSDIKNKLENDIVIEVGGKGKGREQFKGITVKKKIILSHKGNIEGIKRPLFLLGFVC